MAPLARRLTVTVAALAVLSVTGCSSSDRPADVTTTTTAPTTAPTTSSAQTASTTTTATLPQIRPAALPTCAAGATSYTTVTDWVVDDLPPGTRTTSASTGVLPPQVVAGDVDLITVLVGPASGGTRPTVVVARSPRTATTTPEWDPSVPLLRSVRGGPGTVGRTISRSGAGPTTAVWDEAGTSWSARSDTLSTTDLVAALGGLRLDRSGATDPTGAFERVGNGPAYAPGAWRVTQLEVRTTAADPADERVRYVRIDPAAPGTVGPTQVPRVGVRTLARVDGRVLLLGGFDAVSTTPDGSLVTISSYDGSSRPVALDPGTVRAIVAGLRRRAPADDAAVAAVPLGPAGVDGAAPPDFCREP